MFWNRLNRNLLSACQNITNVSLIRIIQWILIKCLQLQLNQPFWVSTAKIWQRLACTSDSLFTSRVLQKLRVHFFTRQLNISHHGTTNETILHGPEIHKTIQRFRTFVKYHTRFGLQMVFNTYSMCGYFSVSFTLISVSLMFRYWSTECNVPHILKREPTKLHSMLNQCTILCINVGIWKKNAYLKSFLSSTITSFPTNDLKNE